MLTPDQIAHYDDHGYLVVPNFLDRDTTTTMRDHYMALRAKGPYPGDSGGTDDQPNDGNHKYPRMIHMQKWDEHTASWSAQPKILEPVARLIHDEPVLNQTMLYFKPPQSRGQGLHQDEQYITIDPLIGIWIPLEKSDRDTGQMVVVPGSHTNGIYKVEKANTEISFTTAQTVLPKNANIIGLDMEAGDALFFHGRIIHGSYPNTTTDRWRRTFICHYVGKHAKKFEPKEGTHVSHVNRD